jgi:hypothetical protein
MKQQKLNITFHNPNPKEETVDYIVKLLAEAAVSKVIKKQEEELANQKKAFN